MSHQAWIWRKKNLSGILTRVGESIGICGLGSKSQKRKPRYAIQVAMYKMFHFLKNISSNRLKHYQSQNGDCIYQKMHQIVKLFGIGMTSKNNHKVEEFVTTENILTIQSGCILSKYY